MDNETAVAHLGIMFASIALLIACPAYLLGDSLNVAAKRSEHAFPYSPQELQAMNGCASYGLPPSEEDDE